MLMAPCPCPDCNPHPVQARLFGAALVEAELGDCADCDQPATKLLVGGADQPDVSVCERCEYGRYLQATSGRDYANEERSRWGYRHCHDPTSATHRRQLPRTRRRSHDPLLEPRRGFSRDWLATRLARCACGPSESGTGLMRAPPPLPHGRYRLRFQAAGRDGQVFLVDRETLAGPDHRTDGLIERSADGGPGRPSPDPVVGDPDRHLDLALGPRRPGSAADTDDPRAWPTAQAAGCALSDALDQRRRPHQLTLALEEPDTDRQPRRLPR